MCTYQLRGSSKKRINQIIYSNKFLVNLSHIIVDEFENFRCAYKHPIENPVEQQDVNPSRGVV
jgi:hypothetical protein